MPPVVDVASIERAARRSFQIGRPLKEPARLVRVAVGMIVAAVTGYLLHRYDAQVLLCVGAFLAGVGSLVPHNRSRFVAGAGTGLAEIVAAFGGVTLHQLWAVILPVLALGLFASGLLRAVAIGISMRTLVVTIIFVAFAEITPGWRAGVHEVLFFAGGVGIMLCAQLLPPYEPRHHVQRQAVAAFYEAAARGSAPLGAALLAADRSLALLRRSRHAEILRLVELVERGEEIAQLLRAVEARADGSAGLRAVTASRLLRIASLIRTQRSAIAVAPWAAHRGGDPVESALVRAVDDALELAEGRHPGHAASDERRPPTSAELVRDELHRGSPILHHAVRLAGAGVVGELVGLSIGRISDRALILPGHGFWVLVAVALILFPDYGETFTRGIGRTLGSILGAIAGVALSLVPWGPAGHTVVLVGLFLGYLAFRSCGQLWTMLWVVAWISSLTSGFAGAVTRGSETVVGCLLALAIYLLFPTYQRRRFADLVGAWAYAQAEQLTALAGMWRAQDEAARLHVAHATVRSRLTRLELLEAAAAARHEPLAPSSRWHDDEIDAAVSAVSEIATDAAVLAALVPAYPDSPEQSRIAAADIARQLVAVTDGRVTSYGAGPGTEGEGLSPLTADRCPADVRDRWTHMDVAVGSLAALVGTR